MRYAINIADMSKSPDFFGILFSPFYPREKQIIRAEAGVMDGSALLLDITDGRMIESLLHIIRKIYSKNHFRIYMSKTGKGGWKRI
jgi:hypothetical protein